MSKAQLLLECLDDLTWETYIEVCDAATKFSDHEIDNEMMRQATVYSYYQGMLSLAKKALDDEKLMLTTYIASSRRDCKDNSSTKLTAKDLDDLVESGERFEIQSRRVNDSEFKYTLLKGLVEALGQKKDMLIQISSNRRAETKLYNH